MNNKTLVVDLNRKFLTKSLFFAPFMIGFLACLFYIDKSIIYYLFGYYVYFIIQGFFVTFILGITTGSLFSLWTLFDKTPIAIIDEKGIWFKDHGFVSWSDIEHIDVYTVGNTPMEVVGVRLKDINKISKQSRWPGKLRLFWSKLFKHNAHIDLSNLNVANEKIVEFARQFINIESSNDSHELFEE